MNFLQKIKQPIALVLITTVCTVKPAENPIYRIDTVGIQDNATPQDIRPTTTNNLKARKTPLHIAALFGRTDMAEPPHANIEAQDNYGNTPLHLAAKNGHNEKILLLREYDANVNATNTSGDTPLHLAIESRKNSTARLLIDCSANVNAQRFFCGATPLHYALLVKDNVAITLLLNHPNINLRIPEYINNKTPLDMLTGKKNNFDTQLLNNQNNAQLINQTRIMNNQKK